MGRARTQAGWLSSWEAPTSKPTVLHSVSELLLLNIWWLLKIGLRKWNFFSVKEFFFADFGFKIDVKMNFRIITKNHAADSEIGCLLKIDFRAVWTHESNPTAWELTKIRFLWLFFQRSKVAHAVLEYKEFVIESGIRTIDEEKMQYFLDRFYMSRIAIRVLINQHGNFLPARKN